MPSFCLVLCLRLSHQNCLKNKTKCPPFFSFLVDFGVIFPPGGTPGRPPLGAQVGSQVEFFMLFRCPWGGFGAPFGSLGLPWGVLGSHLGAKSGAKSVKKSIPGAQCGPEASLGAKREGPRPSECDENTAPADVLARGRSRQFGI